MNLDRDLEWLRTEHGIDDTMIESLTASPEQARDHLAFWITCMWAVNGALLATTIIGMLFATRWLLATRSVVAGIVLAVTCLAIAKVSTAVLSQKQAIAAIRDVGKRHDLL